MAWQRSGDTGATYPQLMAVRGDSKADERSVNELAGFIWRLSMLSGAHLTDYVLDVGTVEMIGSARTTELVRLAVKVGLLTKVRTPHGMGFKLLEDPDFIHLRSRADVEWERQQRNDTRDMALIVPVRRRDGDHCRWCGMSVLWRGRKTKRSAEYDHLVPGQAATVETFVVACRGCNSARGGDHERWDSEHTLRPAPARPHFGTWTAQLLTENGYPTEPTGDDERLAPALGAGTAPTGVRPATGTSDGTALAPRITPEVPPYVGRNSHSGSDRTTHAGSGRVGSGLGSAGLGEAPGLPSPPPSESLSRRRGRRGGRPRTPALGDLR
jgi:hypothetical protein